MKENLEEDIINKENNNNSVNTKETEGEIKENNSDNNPFEIITDEEVKNVKKEDHRRKKTLMYILNKDENIYSDPNNDFNQNEIREANSLMVEFLTKNKNTFKHINPLRRGKKSKEKPPDESLKYKKRAIKVLVTNLKTQYIIFNIRDFIRQYHLVANPKINTKLHKIAKIIQHLCLNLYVIIMFFEKPWFCYEGTTIPLPSNFTFIEECEDKVEFSGLPFIHDNALRIIEILQTVIIAVTQVIKYKNELILKDTNIGLNKLYNIIQIFLFLSLLFCFVDLVGALLINKFPIINFIIRPFIYIYMLRRLRTNWLSVLKILWKTKINFFILLINIVTFSCIGYFLFSREDGYFKSLGESLIQLYILLTTCNFPDIMLDAMKSSKFAILFFIIYISINIFIILSFLKSLYIKKYHSVYKKDCLKIIKDIFQNTYNQHIFNGKKFNNFLLEQKEVYSLTKEEFDNFLILFNLYNKVSDIFDQLNEMFEKSPEEKFASKNKLGNYILYSYILEIIINLLCIGTTIILISNNYLFLVLHFTISICFVYEPILLIYYLGIKRFAFHHIKRMFFHIINIINIILIIILTSLYSSDDDTKYLNVFNIFKIFISLRTIRIFILLDRFQIIQNIYVIIRVSKEMIYRNLLILFSFFFIFSTFTILLTGGNIKRNNFENLKVVPNKYVHTNYNDFGSSYITCFCLMMINNLNILVNALTYNLDHKMFYRFYFASFYFFSTLIIVNIIQTLLLEMYLISDNSPHDKKEINNDNDKINENIEGIDDKNPFGIL